MYRGFLVSSLMFLLSACEPPLTRDQQLNIYRTRCLEYGYTPGTVEFAHCMQDQEKHHETLAVEEKKTVLLEEKNKIARQDIKVKEKETSPKGWTIQW